MDMKSLTEQEKQLEAQLAEVRKHQQLLKDNEDIEIAEILHKRLCRSNHTDGCDWEYYDWKSGNLGYAKKEYLEKARQCRKDADKATILKIIGHL